MCRGTWQGMKLCDVDFVFGVGHDGHGGEVGVVDAQHLREVEERGGVGWGGVGWGGVRREGRKRQV